MVRTPLTEDDWRALGFDAMRVGATSLETGPAEMVLGDPAPGDAPVHRNTATKVDHAVLRVPSLDRAVAELGLEERRRGGPRDVPMSFLRAGEAVIELVETGADTVFWGVAFRVASIEAAVAAAGGRIGAPTRAVQGGWIAAALDASFPVAVLERGPTA